MRVSIVIPTLNEERNIVHAVETALATRAEEVVVVDGGSEDSTRRLARQTRATVIRSAPGRAVQQNTGARASCGDILLFQHADNWLADSAVDQLREAFSDDNLATACFQQRIDAPGMRYRLLEWGNAWRARWLRLPYGDQGIAVRRSTFDRIGGFPEVPIMEDFMLMRSLARTSRPAVLAGPIHVSARRWARYGVIRQTLANWSLALACRLGVSPVTLARFYPRHGEKRDDDQRDASSGKTEYRSIKRS